MSAWVGTVAFVVGLAVAIAIHEWGHFWTARRFGMRAERYFIGFGPTLWSTRRGEVEYGVKWILFGGFVRIAGMSTEDVRLGPVAQEVFDPDAVAQDRRSVVERSGLELEDVPALPDRTWKRLDGEMLRRGVPDEQRRALVERTRRHVGGEGSPRAAADAFAEQADGLLEDTGRFGDVRHRVLRGDEGRFFHDRPAWQRAIVLASGSGMHFVQAIALLFVAFWAFGVQPSTTIGDVLPGSPAEEAGMETGSTIVAVERTEVRSFEQVRQVLAERPAETVAVTIERDGARDDVGLTTAVVVDDVPAGSELAAAGLLPRDRILAVDGTSLRSMAQLRQAAAGGGEVTLSVERFAPGGVDGEEIVTLTEDVAVPADLVDDVADRAAGMAGFVPDVTGFGPVGALRATFVGEGSFPAMVSGTFEAFGALFGPEGLGAIPAQLAGAERDPTGASLASPVGLAQVAGEGTAAAGLFFLLGLLAALNVFVGIFNLVPLPPLDGGHLAVLAVERSVNGVRQLRGQPADYRIDPRAVSAVAVPVILLLGFLFLAVLVLDITNPLRLPQ
jgi:regulator of sigma E protease